MKISKGNGKTIVQQDIRQDKYRWKRFRDTIINTFNSEKYVNISEELMVQLHSSYEFLSTRFGPDHEETKEVFNKIGFSNFLSRAASGKVI